jgi:hypothetical protein
VAGGQPSTARTRSRCCSSSPTVAAHDAYQIDPVHKAFHERCVKYWSKAVA